MSRMDTLKAKVQAIVAFCVAYSYLVEDLAKIVKAGLYDEYDALDRLVRADPTGQGRRGQVDTIITVVVVAVVAIVGILIYSEVDGSISVSGDLGSSQTNLTDGFGDAMELVPIVLIVLVAALVIGVISRFRNSE